MWTAIRLNVLLVRFHLGFVKDLAMRVANIFPKLPVTAGISCLGLAIASAHKAGDLGTTRDLACSMAKDVESPWDLPTLPKLFLGAGRQVIVLESASVTPMLDIIKDLKANCHLTVEQSSLLEALAERYRARRVA